MLLAIAMALGPLSRTTPTALTPAAVARATMVSAAGASGARGVLRLPARTLGLATGFGGTAGPVHQPLLADLQHVGDGPVERQPGRDGIDQEHQREDDRHEQHHARLRR